MQSQPDRVPCERGPASQVLQLVRVTLGGPTWADPWEPDPWAPLPQPCPSLLSQVLILSSGGPWAPTCPSGQRRCHGQTGMRWGG